MLVPALDTDGATDADAPAADAAGDGALTGAAHDTISAATAARRDGPIAISLMRLRCSPAQPEQVLELTQCLVDVLRA